MQGSILVHQLRKVIKIVDLLRDIGLDKQLSLPKVVVLGNQSSGKSSLLQQIVGLDFLPRGSGVVTRRPLQLRMNNIPELKQPYAEFDQVMEGGKKKRFTNFSQVRKTINEVTDKVCGQKKVIKDIPIVLNIFSPACPNLTMVDLPGITSIPVGDQPKNIYQITRDMAMRYIKEKRSIILCVIPANQDLSTSQALKTMRDIDPNGDRSIGCLTKIDIMNRGDDATKILKNQEIPLRYGYVGIKNRSQEDVLNNVPVSESLKTQRLYFTKSPIYSTLPPDCFSTQSLTKKLTNILYQQIKGSMPQIFEQIKKKRSQAEEQLQKLGPGVANTDGQLVNYAWKSISIFLRIFKNSLSGIKNAEITTDPISSEIREQLSSLYKEQYDNQATQQLKDKDIQKAIINFPGSTIPGFPSIDAFLALLNPLLKKLSSPAFSCNNRVHEIMDAQATKIVNHIMIKKYPQFNTRFNDLVRRVLEKHRKDLENYLNMLLDAQIDYLYTNDMGYLNGDFQLSQKEKKKLDEGKIKDPLVFELRKRIDSYYQLVVRNLRDLVPRQIFNFLISKCLKQLEFQAFQFTSDVNKLKEWLNQPSQIRVQRQKCIHAIKVFEQSQKRIRMDPDIAKLIRNTKKQSKYYQKFGIKTLQQQQKEAQEAAFKSRISQQQQKPKIESRTQSRQTQQHQPPRNQQNQKSPQTSSSSSEVHQTKDLSNMFGTNIIKTNNQQSPVHQSKPQNPNVNPNQSPAHQSKPQNPNVNPNPSKPANQPPPMQKQPNPVGTGVTSPQSDPKAKQNNFGDIWNQANTKTSNNQPPATDWRKPDPKVSSNQQPPSNTQYRKPETKGPEPRQQKPAEQKQNRSATFNQLFGLGGRVDPKKQQKR